MNEINPKLEAAYWPILEKSYWVSPLPHTYELENLIKDLQKNNHSTPLKILIDLELPFLNKKLFLTNLFSFHKNKRMIKGIFEDADELNIEISTAEYPVLNNLNQKILEKLGIFYSNHEIPHNKILLFYSSMKLESIFKNQIKKFIIHKSKEDGQNFQVGLGTIAKGILGTEPILSPTSLD